MSWDAITEASAGCLRSRLPGLRPVPGRLETYDHAIANIETNRDHTVAVGWIEGDPEEGNRFGVYGLEELKQALEYAEAFGAEAVCLVEGPREFAGYPRLVLLCEGRDGYIGRRCVVVAPREDVQQEAVCAEGDA